MTIDNLQEDLLKLFVSVVLGSIIGAEREYRTKSAGFRTLILVSVGSTLFTLFSIRISANSPDRIAANIITGIGFLGAGAIFRSDDRVFGLTTATTIWMTAALGMGVGMGEYILCGLATAVILLVLLGFTYIEKFIDDRSQNRNYKIVCEYREETLYHYEELFRACNLKARRGKQSKIGDNMVGVWELQGSEKNHQFLIAQLMKDKQILEFDF